MSMTCATSSKVSSGSALTNMIFSARVLKMSLRRPSRFSHVTSSWLILSAGLSPPPLSTCTTMVRSLLGGVFCWSLGGWGTSASRPFGVSGVITMKMMSNTSKTSIIGVTLMSALGPSPGPPIAILIRNSRYWAPAPVLVPVVGGFFPAAPVCLCSVNRATSSTPAERTLSTTSTTAPNLARASALIKTRLSTLLARRSITLAVSWSAETLSVPKKICPSRMMATSKASSLSASCMGTGLLTLAMSTLTPFCNMGVMTMKMMSNTSITSTMGVTLMLELTFLPSARTDIAITFNLLQTGASANGFTLSSSPANRAAFEEVVDQLAGAVVHFHVEGFHLVSEVVEHHDGRNRDEESDSGGHQGFRDTAGNGAQAGRFLGRNLLEGVENAHHGAQQANEGSSGTDGGQAAQTALQLGMNDGFGTLQSALGSFDLFAGDVVGIAVGLELLKAGDHDLGQMTFLVAFGDPDGFLDFALTQGTGHSGSKRARLLAGRAVCHGAIDHNANRPARHNEQNEDNDLGQNSHLFPEGDGIPAHGGFLENPGGSRRHVAESIGGKVS